MILLFFNYDANSDTKTKELNPSSFPILLPCPLEGVVPGPPTDLQVIEATKNYVVLSWKPPGQRGHEGIMYFVEKVKLDRIRIMMWQYFTFVLSSLLDLWLTFISV